MNLIKWMCLAFAFAASFGAAKAQMLEPPVRGQTVYVPIYSEIKYGNLRSTGLPEKAQVAILVSIRNTDPASSLRIVKAPYYDTKGRLLRDYMSQETLLGPFGTAEIFVELRESEGGSGANFAIEWDAAKPISPPIIEALHTRVQPGYSIAFISRGKVIAAR